jgi:hypothetical protein
MKLTTKIILIVTGILIVSLAVNVFQYRYYRKKPVIESTIETQITDKTDTVYIPVYGKFQLLDPTPVFIDSFKNYVEFKDTFLVQHGYIATSEKVRGELLSKGLEYKLNVPEYYKTRTITNTVTHTVRNNCLFVTGGFNYNYVTQGFFPNAGLTYIWNKHKRIISLEYSLDKRIDLSVVFSLWR